MFLTVISSVNKVLPTIGRTLMTEVITVSNILYPLAAVTSHNNSRKNFIDRGYHSSNILYPLAAVTSYNNSRNNFIDRDL
jgi:hypothetical protein